MSHEEVRVDREPITDATRCRTVRCAHYRGGARGHAAPHAEQPVVDKEAVPVERVRLSTDTVTENHTVEDQVRKEQIDEPTIDGHS
jgi:stress response protein YsnF